MRTQMLGQLTLDEPALADELDRSRSFDYAEQYPEFQCGRRPWQTCMLWSVGGEVGDGVIARYDTNLPCRPTVFGEQLPYLARIVEENFAVEHMLFCRMVAMSDNVLVPHRDFVEFTDRPAEARATHRLHVPLATSEDCLFMEDNVIYRMLPGEVWSLDVSRMHSAAVLSDVRRVHLILDFADVPDARLLTFDFDPAMGIPECNLVTRPPLSERERAAMLALADAIDQENLSEVLGMLIKKQYRKDGGENFVWGTLRQLGGASGDERLDARIRELYQHCMLERDE